MSEYPVWAPNELVEYRSTLVALIEKCPEDNNTRHRKVYVSLLHDLLTSLDMKGTWERHKGNESRLFHYIARCQDLSASDKMPKSERKDEQREIVRNLRSLAVKLTKHSLGLSLIDYFEDHHLTGMNMHLQGFDFDSSEDDLKKAMIESPLPKTRLAAFQVTPSISQVLENLAVEIEETAPLERSLVDKPGQINSKVIHLVRRLGNGGPFLSGYRFFRKDIANITNAVFMQGGIVIHSDQVKDWLKPIRHKS